RSGGTDGHAPRHHAERRRRRRDEGPARDRREDRRGARSPHRPSLQGHGRKGEAMSSRVIDLSQPLSRESQLHPFFPPTQILRHIVHTDAPPGRPSFSAEIIITSNHAATHVDAFGHYDKG